jgi:hypothetical protein
MIAETWHTDFNPQRFLSRVSLAELIERNEAYNESSVTDARSPCIYCGGATGRGILLNDKSFPCQQCYSEVAMISYPERYEALLCPKCGAPMGLKKPRKPSDKWNPFWGCTRFKDTGCKGSAKYVATNR